MRPLALPVCFLCLIVCETIQAIKAQFHRSSGWLQMRWRRNEEERAARIYEQLMKMLRDGNS